MNAEIPHISSGRFSFRRWIEEQIVAVVPAEIAVCEFDCDKTQCTMEEWKVCPRRLSKEPVQ